MNKTIFNEIQSFFKRNNGFLGEEISKKILEVETLENFFTFAIDKSIFDKKKTLFIHIGMHKTGSSSIQENLSKLNVDSFKYINLNICNHSGPLLRLFEHKIVKQDSFLDKDRKQNFELLVNEITTNSHQKMMVSGEDIVRLSKKALIDFKIFMSLFFFELKIVGYVRSPKAFLESAFQQKLKKEKDFIGFDLKKMLPIYKWRFQKIDEVFGRENVYLWKYDVKNFVKNNVVNDLCFKLDIPLNNIDIITHNESLSLEAISILYTYRKYSQNINKVDSSILQALTILGSKKFHFAQEIINPLLSDIEDDISWIEKRINVSIGEEHNLSEFGITDEHGLEKFAIESFQQLKNIFGEIGEMPDFENQNLIQQLVLYVDKLRTNPLLLNSINVKKNNATLRLSKHLPQLIILSTQRSGSTMVCDDISGSGVLGKPSEYFIKVISKIDTVSSSEMAQLVSNSLEKGRTANGVVAIKIMSNQITSIGKALVQAEVSSGKDFQEAFYNFFRSSVFVRVIRNDKVAQAVSRVMARQTNVYHTVDNLSGLEGMLGNVSKQRDESGLKYDFEEIKAEVDKIKTEERFLDQFTDRFQLEVSPIFYEEVVNDRSYIHKLSESMQIRGVELKERRLKKVSGSMASEWIEAYKYKITPAVPNQNEKLPNEGVKGIEIIGHRDYVGGLWDELGILQLGFLKLKGLEPEHIFLDIACGPLRAGVHFIEYLDQGNYLGIDKEAELIKIGVEKELSLAIANEKKPEFVVSDCFEFNQFSKVPDFAIAQSLFTHLIGEDIKLCLKNLKSYIGDNRHKFFATFFEVEGESKIPLEYSHSLVNFFYTRDQMIKFGEDAGWKVEYIGDWNHPRNQKMILYYQD